MRLITFTLALAIALCANGQSSSGNSIDFTFATDYARSPASNSLSNINFPFTVMVWMKATTSTSVSPIFSTANSTIGYTGINLVYDPVGQEIQVILGNNSGFAAANYIRMSASTPGLTGKWVHVAVTMNNATTGSIYINGVSRTVTFDGTANNASFPAGIETSIGFSNAGGGDYFSGELDELTLWDRVLPVNDIRQRMCEKVPANANGLVGHYQFDNTGGVVVDASTSGVDMLYLPGQGVSNQLSGVPLGDQSVFIYGIGTATISSPTGVSLTVFNNTTPQDGVHAYFIADHPDQAQGLGALCDTIGHFGRFIATNPAQPNIPGVISLNPAMSLIFTRPSANQGTWTTAPVTQTLFFSDIIREFLFDPGAYPAVSIDDRVPICASGTVTAPSLIGATYNWSTGQMGQTISTPPVGTHWVTIATNCASVVDTFEVYRDTAFDASALPATAFYCPGDTAILTVYNSTARPPIDSVVWSDGVKGISRDAFTPGWYTAYTAVSGTCWQVDSIFVSEGNQSFELGNDTTLCGGEEILLEVPPTANNVLWSTGDTTFSLRVDQPGQYFVNFDINGCNLGDTILVNVLNFQITQPPIVAFCIGEDATITVNANSTPDSVYWSTGSNDPAITVTAAGVYWVEAFRGNCYDSDTTVVEVLEGVTQVNDQDYILCEGDTLELRLDGLVPEVYINDIVWNTGDVGDSLLVTAGGFYTANGISPCGPYEVGFFVDEVNCTVLTYFPNAFTPNGDGLNDYYEFQVGGLEEYRITILDRWGNVVFESYNGETLWDGTIGGTTVPNGAYVYRLVGTSYRGEVIDEAGTLIVSP